MTKREMTDPELLAWLMKKWKNPKGKIRRNRPFGPREGRVIENYDHFEKRDDSGRRYGSYRIYATNGDYFEYTYENGRIEIIDVSYYDPQSLDWAGIK